MEINKIIDLTRSLLRQGDTGKALETLRVFLEQNPRYAETLRTLRVVEANYNSARQQEIKGILSFQEAQRQYNQVNDALFSTLDDLASGRTPARQPTAMSSPAASSSRLIWIGGGAVVLIVGVIAGIWFSRKGASKGDTGASGEEITCPAFSGPGQRVIILPFQNIGSVTARPDLIIQSRIRELSSKNNFSSAVEVLTSYDPIKNNPDIADASRIGRLCEADLVIWGQYDKGDSIKVDIRYVFTKSGKLGKTPGFLAFKDLPALRDGRMVRGLDDAIFYLCGLMAIQAKNGPLAKQWFEKVRNPQQMDKTLMDKLNNLRDKIEDKRGTGDKKN